MRPRIEQELALLRQHYGEVEHVEVAGDDWFMLPRYLLPPGWRIKDVSVEHIPVVFLVGPGHPGALPYGFMGPEGINFNGAPPTNIGGPPKPPPFAGAWTHFSWSVDDWAVTADIARGSNLLSWARGFAQRFREGA